MIDALVVVVLVATGVLAVFGLVWTALDRAPDRYMKRAIGVVVALLAVQAVIAGARVLTGVSVPETSTFLIYLVVSVCVLPIAAQFAYAEPTRWGGTVVAVAAIAVAVAVVRVDGLWSAAGV